MLAGWLDLHTMWCVRLGSICAAGHAIGGWPAGRGSDGGCWCCAACRIFATWIWLAVNTQTYCLLVSLPLSCSCAATPSGVELLASGAKDCEVRVWDPSSGACLAVAAGHVAAVTAVAWSKAKSKGGRYLASGGADKLLKLWDTSKLVAAAAATTGDDGELRSSGSVTRATWPACWRTSTTDVLIALAVLIGNVGFATLPCALYVSVLCNEC